MALNYLQTLVTDDADLIWTVAWDPSGTMLATSGADMIIRIWTQNEHSKWSCASKLAASHSKTIRRLAWSPCSQFLASASFDGTICIWRRDLVDSSWKVSVNLEGHENEVKSVAWSHDGNYLATCGRDRTVWIWEKSQDDCDEDDDVGPWDCSDVKTDHAKDVKQVVWHPKHNILASCSYDETVKFFYLDDSDWKCYDTLTGHTSTVWSADFSTSGKLFVTCSHDKTLKIWINQNHEALPSVKEHSWKCLNTIQGIHNGPIYDVSWSKDPNLDIIASVSGDNSIALYKRSSEPQDEGNFVNIHRELDAHCCDINCIAWNPKKPQLFATGSDDGFIKIWSYESDEKGMQSMIEKELDYQTIVTDRTKLINLIKNLKQLRKEIEARDPDFAPIERAFNVSVEDDLNQQPLRLSEVTEDGFVINMKDERNNSECKFKIVIDKTSYNLRLPKRACGLLNIADELFITEKTGDFYKIDDDGQSRFLLGHLFALSDLKLSKDGDLLISADRDEKIRITRYPEAHIIERFAFGHEHFIRRLLIIDKNHFVSIDKEDIACLWDITGLKLMPDESVLRPKSKISLEETTIKRAKLME